jgi:hypothetical protein
MIIIIIIIILLARDLKKTHVLVRKILLTSSFLKSRDTCIA